MSESSRQPVPPQLFEQWVRTHHAAVYSAARRILNDEGEALDAVQEVYRDVWERGTDLAPGQDPAPLLRWMAVRKALALSRSRRTRLHRERGRAEMDRDKEPPVPPQQTEQREEESAVERFLSKLPQDLRHALVLRFHEGLTFREVSDALECSEPTAHDRVRRGLERLKLDLSRAGFGAVAAALPEHLARAPWVPVPPALENKLLALGAKRSALTLGGFQAPLLLPACAAVLAVLGGVWIARGLLGDRTTPPLAASFDAEAPSFTLEEIGGADGERLSLFEAAPAGEEAPGASPAAVLIEEEVVDAHGTVRGRVLSAAGDAVAGLKVVAESAARDSKFARHRVETFTEPNGTFTASLPVTGADEAYILSLWHADFVRRRSESFVVRPGGTVTLPDLVVEPNSGDATGNWTLEVTVVDEQGRPVEAAAVRVERELAQPGGYVRREVESRGVTDAAGFLSLSGERLGEKTLVVSKDRQNLIALELPLALEAPTLVREHCVMQPGLVLAGLVRTVAGEVPPNARLRAVCEETERSYRGDPDEEGRFEILALPPGTYTLAVEAYHYSSVHLPGLAAGTRGLSVSLKPYNDVRDVGDHDAELHGKLVDAETGEQIPANAFSVEVYPYPESGRIEDLLPQIDRMQMRQRAAAFQSLEDADFHETGLAPGRYAIVAHHAGYARALFGPIELTRGELRTGIEVPMDRGATVSGVVLDEAGLPVAGAYVFVTAQGQAARDLLADVRAEAVDGRGEKPIYLVRTLRTDRLGRFEFERVPSGYELVLGAAHHASGSALGTPLALEAGGTFGGNALRLER